MLARQLAAPNKKEEFFIKQIPIVLWAKKRAFFFGGWMVDDFADKFIVIYYLILGYTQWKRAFTPNANFCINFLPVWKLTFF